MRAGRCFLLLAATSLASGFSASVSAADLATRKPPVVASPPAFTWTGFYLGFNYGYAWRGSSDIAMGSAPLFNTAAGIWTAPSALGATGLTGAGLNGFFGGVQAGYNLQFADRWVAGLEADLQGGGIRGGGGFGSIIPTTLPGFAVTTSSTMHRGLQHLGTVRARLGYTVQPDLLAYLTAGLVFGGTSTTATINQVLNPSALASAGARADRFEERFGFAVGAGAEMAIAPNLSIKFEYLYYGLGSPRAAYPSFAPLVHIDPILATALGNAMVARTRFDGHLLRTGLNYRFGGQGSELGRASGYTAAQTPAFGSWNVSVSPYVWGIGINGATTALGQTTDVNMSFVDALTKSSSLPLAFMANFEARTGPVSLYGDLVWAQIRIAGSLMSQRNPIAGLALSLDGDARMKTTIAIVEGGGTYEMARWAPAGGQNAFTAIDAVAGLRYWRIGLDVSLNIVGAANLANLGLSQVGGKAIAKSGDLTWVDPFFGLRLRQQVDARNSFYLKADIGGFGVGSKIAWQAAGGYTHDFEFAGMKWTSMVGYRALYADYSKGAGLRQSGFNSIIHGPMSGLGMKF